MKMFQESWVTGRLGHGRMLRKTISEQNPSGRKYAVMIKKACSEHQKIMQIQANLPRHQRAPAMTLGNMGLRAENLDEVD